jgi:hypothetical protein
MANKTSSETKDNKKWIGRLCGECKNVTPYMAQHTLTVHGKKPTMGTCPEWTSSKCVLLSQAACEKFK